MRRVLFVNSTVLLVVILALGATWATAAPPTRDFSHVFCRFINDSPGDVSFAVEHPDSSCSIPIGPHGCWTGFVISGARLLVHLDDLYSKDSGLAVDFVDAKDHVYECCKKLGDRAEIFYEFRVYSAAKGNVVLSDERTIPYRWMVDDLTADGVQTYLNVTSRDFDMHGCGLGNGDVYLIGKRQALSWRPRPGCTIKLAPTGTDLEVGDQLLRAVDTNSGIDHWSLRLKSGHRVTVLQAGDACVAK